MKKILLGLVLGVGLVFGYNSYAKTILVSPNSSTLQGVYDLVMGRLDSLDHKLDILQDTCATH